MFEKEAQYYAFDEVNHKQEWYIKHPEHSIDWDYEDIKKHWGKGAEFGYNKANEWQYPSKGEYPEKGKEILLYTKTLGLIFGEFCEGYNNLWTSNRCDFTTEEIIAWIEKEKILPKESE